MLEKILKVFIRIGLEFISFLYIFIHKNYIYIYVCILYKYNSKK